jgi:ABC transporter substrate binding protein
MSSSSIGGPKDILSACRACDGLGSPSSGRDPYYRRQRTGPGSKGCHNDNSYRIFDRCRSGEFRANPQPQSAGKQRHRCDYNCWTARGKTLAASSEVSPSARKVGMLVNPNNPQSEPETADVRAAAQVTGQQIKVLPATNGEEIDKAFATVEQLKLDALVVNPDPVFASSRHQLVALAARYAVPTIYYAREYVDVGGLMSYGASFAWLYRQGGIYVARILKGEKPADLAVIQPTKFEFVINAKTVKALGLTIPVSQLALADEVIE